MRHAWSISGRSWDGQPIPAASGETALPEEVKAGGATTLRMMVTPPPGSGLFRCAFTVKCGAEMAVPSTNSAMPVTPLATVNVRPGKFIPVELNTAFNSAAASADSLLDSADVDGSGNSFPLDEFLPDATNPVSGFQPGYYTGNPNSTLAGFTFAAPVREQAPMLRATGQEIPLPERNAATLSLAAFTIGSTNPRSSPSATPTAANNNWR